MWRNNMPDPTPLIEECTAFLAGRYADLLVGRGRPRPSWSWLNALAHRTEEELGGLASSLGRHESGGNWAMANAFLAGELLVAVAGGEPLASLQSRVLVPLELDLLSSVHGPIWSPSDYVTEVLQLLDHHLIATRTQQRRAGR